jgi:hypothetical protein
MCSRVDKEEGTFQFVGVAMLTELQTPPPTSAVTHVPEVGWAQGIRGQGIPTGELQPACSQLELMAFRVEASFT